MTRFDTTRDIAATPAQVFAAISDPSRLARWWGPAGFTNTFSVCEFRNGGRWIFVMHSPDGHDHPNDSRFADIEAGRQVVIEHLNAPLFRLCIMLSPTASGTRVSWSQAFDDDEIARRIAPVVVPANEQNLDRLTAEVLGGTARPV